jgi:hypothetical protein
VRVINWRPGKVFLNFTDPVSREEPKTIQGGSRITGMDLSVKVNCQRFSVPGKVPIARQVKNSYQFPLMTSRNNLSPEKRRL